MNHLGLRRGGDWQRPETRCRPGISKSMQRAGFRCFPPLAMRQSSTRKRGLCGSSRREIRMETGTLTFTDRRNWDAARNHCIAKNVGGRKGWRLPSIPELASLVDPSVASPGPTLPPGHPFSNVQSINYWSATSLADSTPLDLDGTFAWSVLFEFGRVFSDTKSSTYFVWCVRGGMNADQY
jgi:hypothetical protein